MAEEAETAASKQDIWTLYRITKTLTKGFQSIDIPVKDQQGNTIFKEEDILRCWNEHFEKVLNRDDPGTKATIAPAPTAVDISTDPPR